ncbi:fam-c protein [Plasmodium vinckei petteri]|uniref:Fam-c protein n=1 Tax=Plasmodium vinckei petteri TaxID=138298 RepID=A0A6V7SCD1_PLAVN|nr:fam-c protein [Plasmodium vinckei petteri]
MNRRVFSLVCIVFYALLAVSIHCSEQKVSCQTKHKLIHGKLCNSGYLHVVTKEKNGIESKCETQLNNNNNNNPKYDDDDEGCGCCCKSKRDKRNKITTKPSYAKVSPKHSYYKMNIPNSNDIVTLTLSDNKSPNLFEIWKMGPDRDSKTKKI